MLMKRVTLAAIMTCAIGATSSLNALPLSGKIDTANVKSQIIKVAQRGGSKKTSRRGYYSDYGYVQNNHVHAPGTHVTSTRDYTEVDAPYAYVKRTRRGIKVRAPYVNINIPR